MVKASRGHKSEEILAIGLLQLHNAGRIFVVVLAVVVVLNKQNTVKQVIKGGDLPPHHFFWGSAAPESKEL